MIRITAKGLAKYMTSGDASKRKILRDYKDRHKIIKLDLGKDHPKPEMIRIVLQVTYVAAQTSNLHVLPKDVIYVEAERGTQHSGVNPKLGT